MIWERRGYLAAVAVLALALVAAGCGGNDTAAEELPQVPKAQLVKKGTAICEHGNKVINAEFSDWGTKNAEENKIASNAELDEETAKVVLPIRKMEVRRLRALGIPDQDAQQFKKLLVAMEEGIERGEEDRSTLRAADERYAFAKAFDLGIAFGLKRCWLEE
jgi:hypothetical protein